MRNFKKIVAIVLVAGVLGAAGAAYAAATAKSPAEIAAGLTGKSMEELNKERAAGKTYGSIAKDAGKLEEFKAQMLEQKKALLDQRVKDGILAKEQADEIYNAIRDNQALCDGAGSAGACRKYGAGFGCGMGMGKGQGACGSAGMRNGTGGGCRMGTR